MSATTRSAPDTAVVEADASAGYYGHSIVRPHVWKDAIGWYFFTGGLSGASAVLAEAAEIAGRPAIARHARRASILGLLPSPVLLIVDLGRPERFANMLRVFKLRSPMSVGSWLLTVFGPAAGGSWMLHEIGRLPRLRRVAGIAAAALGPAMATYTAVLVADTATPVWHEAKEELPFVFAASAAASAGAATTALAALDVTPAPMAARLAVAGSLGEVMAAWIMRRRLGPLDTYGSPPVRRLDRAARSLSLAGAAATVAASTTSRARRALSIAGPLAILAGSVCERLAVVRAGTVSAADPNSVVRQQRP